MSQIRAFLAIDLDDDLKPKINKIIREFKQIDANIKYVDLQNLHFTLKFFGDIDTEGIDLISEKIENVIKDFDSFTIKIKGCGAFPNKNRIKVIWVGLDEDEILKDLHDKLDKEFNSIGFDLDRKFSSHLTIGRMKSAKGKNKVKNTIETYNNIDIGTMDVNLITLKKSTLTPSGPIYEDLLEFRL
ncbi:RNA 2',3'-cyclic phosphodiesterase [Methanobrevibacter millerae]|uniref:RNA 2',3'-cyclic phosphodiesterase n=1 Tax=Methanobrevibacter millerae TaxID=230361 RepID=A0A0U3E474_9EURY|nr:RNA 2',3'-cyclic phosphodiesterase [Methanobrevibacter millerae]ALT68807.1 2'-5' RNA ligase LigT [Methanobrevibacter millerae]